MMIWYFILFDTVLLKWYDNLIFSFSISAKWMRERNVCFIPQVLPPASLNFALFQVLRENPTTKYRNRSSYKRSWLYVLFLALGGPFNANVRTATFKEYCIWWGKSAAWNAFYLWILLQNLCHTWAQVQRFPTGKHLC